LGNATSSDYSGRGNHGTWNGTSTHYAAGKVGTWAGSFNGVNDYITMGDKFDINGVSQTISFWYYPLVNTGDVLISKQNANPSYEGYLIALGYSGGNKIQSVGNGWTFDVISNYSMVNDQWQHVSITYEFYDATRHNTTIYINGVYDNSGLMNSPANTAYNFMIGGNWLAKWMKGSIDDVRIYNRALSAAEVLAIYNTTR